MVHNFILIGLLGYAVAAEPSISAEAQLDAALGASARRFSATPATWMVTFRHGSGDPTTIEAWSRTAGDWRQVRAIRRQGKSQTEVRSLGDICWIKVANALVEVTDVGLRQKLAAIEGTGWLLPRGYDPVVSLVELGAWRGRPASFITGSAPSGWSGPVHGVRWVVTKDDGVVVQVDRFGKDGQVLWSSVLERCERLAKIDATMFTGFSEPSAQRGLSVADMTRDVLAPCEP